MNSPTRVFSQEDVVIGKRIIELLRRNPGRYSVTQAARIARGRDAGAPWGLSRAFAYRR
jgi:hypothetical protein